MPGRHRTPEGRHAREQARFGEPTDARHVRLGDVDRACLEQRLDVARRLTTLAPGNGHVELGPQVGVPLQIGPTQRLFEPHIGKLLEYTTDASRLRQLVALVGIGHQIEVITSYFAGHLQIPDVLDQRATSNLELERAEPARPSILDQIRKLVAAVG